MNKPPPPSLSAWQRLQKSTLELGNKTAEAAGQATRQAAERLREVDGAHNITGKASQAGRIVREAAMQMDNRFGVSQKAMATVDAAAKGVSRTGSAVKQAADNYGVTQVMRARIVDPLIEASKIAGASEVARKTMSRTEGAYGAARRSVKGVFAPDLPTHDSYELLQATKFQLIDIAACILQVSSEESSRLGLQFGRAVTAKIAGAASTTALLGIVASFGHAGTGAAISGLSGAAATSATMAWVGGVVGGGVATGAALTGGLAVVVGLAAYRMLSSKSREFATLSPLEQRIVQSCWMLGAVIDAYQKRPSEFAPAAASELLTNALIPLHRDIMENIVVLCEPLDRKNAVAMRQHVVRDFRSAVIDRFGVYLDWANSDEGRRWWHSTQVDTTLTTSGPPAEDRRENGHDEDVMRVLREGNADAIIGSVFAALLTRSPLDDGTQSRLVLAAIRRTAKQLHGASEIELGDYLRSLDPDGLKGMASNVKGIYHELWYVERYNATHDDTFARIYETTNHPGADVQIVAADSGDVVRDVQLKAVQTNSAVHEHLGRYPDIEVAATDEVAAKILDVRVVASGFTNEKLQDDVQSRLGVLQDHTIAGRIGDTAAIALGIASTAELVQMLRGERAFPEAILNTATKVGMATGATGLTAFLFG